MIHTAHNTVLVVLHHTQNTNQPLSPIYPFSIDDMPMSTLEFLFLLLCLPFVRSLPVEETQTPASTTMMSKRRQSKKTVTYDEDKQYIAWTVEEEIAFCKCWVRISEYIVVGNSRKEQTLKDDSTVSSQQNYIWKDMLTYDGDAANDGSLQNYMYTSDANEVLLSQQQRDPVEEQGKHHSGDTGTSYDCKSNALLAIKGVSNVILTL
uniref:Calmodulin-binding transcription activator 4-like isoform X1 n=1 Tax=Tanacetum cinerariifolium TaxID=118510 RepID=A0A699HMP7_TANCI|nr:calmodulin-binding transcription activator 4-like isoform X1 [Tanacetum cinerariifolium]